MIPTLSDKLPEFVVFTKQLEHDYQAKKLTDWDNLEARVKAFFTDEQTQTVDSVITGWQTMAHYRNGRTQSHVIAVLMGLYRELAYQQLTPEQQAIMEWVVMFHDVAKVVGEGIYLRDAIHGFRSGAMAGLALANIGFPVADTARLQAWHDLTYNAITTQANPQYPDTDMTNELLEVATMRPDNSKLSQIIGELDAIHSQAAALIVKGALFHISLATDPEYPIHSPLSDEEVKRYITPEVYPILRTMMLVDTDGWYLFRPERMEDMKVFTRKTFEHVKAVIGI